MTQSSANGKWAAPPKALHDHTPITHYSAPASSLISKCLWPGVLCRCPSSTILLPCTLWVSIWGQAYQHSTSKLSGNQAWGLALAGLAGLRGKKRRKGSFLCLNGTKLTVHCDSWLLSLTVPAARVSAPPLAWPRSSY